MKWLENQSMKHWKSLTKINLTKKLPFSSTFQEVEFHEVDETIETLNRLNLFTEDSSFDPLISKLTRIISQGRKDKMRQSLINNSFINSNEYKLVMLLKKFSKLAMMLNLSAWHLNVFNFQRFWYLLLFIIIFS